MLDADTVPMKSIVWAKARIQGADSTRIASLATREILAWSSGWTRRPSKIAQRRKRFPNVIHLRACIAELHDARGQTVRERKRDGHQSAWPPREIFGLSSLLRPVFQTG